MKTNESLRKPDDRTPRADSMTDPKSGGMDRASNPTDAPSGTRSIRDLEETLVELIRSKALKPFQPFLPQREICRRFAVSTHTAQAAVNNLAHRGILHVRPRKGVFVSPRPRLKQILFVGNHFLSDLQQDQVTRFFQGASDWLDENGSECHAVMIKADAFESIAGELDFRFPNLAGVVFVRAYGAFAATGSVLDEGRIPYLLYGSSDGDEEEDPPYPNYFVIRNRQISDLALEHLAAHGHRRIGIASQTNPPNDGRIEAWRQWSRLRGLPATGAQVLDLGHGTWKRSLFEFLSDEGRFIEFFKGITALYCTEDQILPALLPRLFSKGIRVPEDVALVAVNDSPFCRHTMPEIDSIEIPLYEHGRACAQAFAGHLEGGSPSVRVVSKAVLHVRESVSPRKGAERK